MSDERGVTFGPIIGIVVVILAIIGFFAVCGDNDGDIDTFAPVELVSHDYDDGGCWEGECYRYDERSGGYGDDRGGDGRFGGGRSGDYDGGPGDDCRNACGNTIIVPSPGGGEGGR